MIPLILAAAAAIAAPAFNCSTANSKGPYPPGWCDSPVMGQPPPFCDETKVKPGELMTCIMRGTLGNAAPTWQLDSSARWVPSHSIATGPHCDPGWSLVTIADQPWCARELRAPKGE